MNKIIKKPLVISALIFLTMIGIFNIVIFSIGNNSVVWLSVLSFISAIFGILNVTTYSIIDFQNPDKYKIFIVFNFLAVIPLAIVNGYNGLWFLLMENVFFAFSGMYQYYNWFIKKEFDTEKFHWNKINWKMIVGLIMLIIGSLLLDFLIVKPTDNYDISSTTIDAVAFSLSFTAAMMVGKKWINSQVIYIISDIILIVWWTLVATLFGGDVITSINLLLLFGFYLSSNIINLKTW